MLQHKSIILTSTLSTTYRWYHHVKYMKVGNRGAIRTPSEGPLICATAPSNPAITQPTIQGAKLRGLTLLLLSVLPIFSIIM